MANEETEAPGQGSESTSNPSNTSSAPTPRDLLEYIPIGHPDTMMSVESVRRAVEEFITKPTDIIVATFAKSGTTLVIWICHLLRTGARDPDSLTGYDTLYDVVPWPTLSWDVGIDPNMAGSQFTPRVFKSHLRMASIYPGCKYVVTVRDPAKVALSFYNFFIAKRVPFVVDPDDDSEEEPKLLMDVSTFLVDTKFLKGCPKTETTNLRASVWEYYVEYHALMECPSVLMLVYEDFVGEEERRLDNIRTLGKFMGILNNGDSTDDDDEALVARTASMSTKSYMAPLVSKFDEPYERAKELNRAADLTQMAPGAKVALQPHTQIFDERAKIFLEDQWKATMLPLGYENYNTFCDAVRERNRKLFGSRN